MPLPPATPRFDDLEAGAGVENLDEAFDDAGGFSTKDVSVVLYRKSNISVRLR
jgi:hypothetical protein